MTEWAQYSYYNISMVQAISLTASWPVGINTSWVYYVLSPYFGNQHIYYKAENKLWPIL